MAWNCLATKAWGMYSEQINQFANLNQIICQEKGCNFGKLGNEDKTFLWLCLIKTN